MAKFFFRREGRNRSGASVSAGRNRVVFTEEVALVARLAFCMSLSIVIQYINKTFKIIYNFTLHIIAESVVLLQIVSETEN